MTTWTGMTAYGGTSHYRDLGGEVHWIDFGGPVDGERIVLVHGLGGSHLDWCRLAPLLTDHARVSAPDLVGFGLSHARGRSASVRDNAAMLERFIGDEAPVTLVGNSMGALVSAIVTRRRPDLVTRLIVIDPALPLVLGARMDPLVFAAFGSYAVPGLGERLIAKRARTLTPSQMLRDTLALCCAHPELIPEDVFAVGQDLIRQRSSEPALAQSFLKAARSLLAFNAKHRRAWKVWADITVPVLLIHGDKDRLVPVKAARVASRRNPSWSFEVLPDVGHVPHLEAPEQIARLVLGFGS